MKSSNEPNQFSNYRRPALDAGLGFLLHRSKKSLTPCQARGDEVGVWGSTHNHAAI
jgi:hypothetical protein